MIDLSLAQNPIGLAKQLIFDCAMELTYHVDGMPDELIANKLLEIINAMDKLDSNK